jgi:hypothetical protein
MYAWSVHFSLQPFRRRTTMSRKEIAEPVKDDKESTSPKMALTLLLVVVFAIIVLGLKFFGVF